MEFKTACNFNARTLMLLASATALALAGSAPVLPMVLGGAFAYGLHRRRQKAIQHRVGLQRAKLQPEKGIAEKAALYSHSCHAGIQMPQLIRAYPANGGINAYAELDKIYITNELAQAMPPSGIDAILAHEVGHLKNDDSGRLTTLSRQLACARTLRGAFLGAALAGTLAKPMLAFALLAPAGMTAVTTLAVRRLEYDADAFSARSCGSGVAMARALRQFERAYQQTPHEAGTGLQVIGPATSLEGLGPLRIDRKGRMPSLQLKQTLDSLLLSDPFFYLAHPSSAQRRAALHRIERNHARQHEHKEFINERVTLYGQRGKVTRPSVSVQTATHRSNAPEPP